MLDQAGIYMAQGSFIACERISGVNDNMDRFHYHNYYELYYLEDGERYQCLQDQTYRMERGEMMLFSPYVMHFSYGEENVPFKRVVLYFHPDTIESEELFQELQKGNGMYRLDFRGRTKAGRLIDSLLWEQENSQQFRTNVQKLLLNLLLYTLVRQERMQPLQKQEEGNRMSQVIQYIHLHYAEDLALKDLAQKFYISPYYLCREFKEYTGRTLIQYINMTRIMNAQRKFMETDKNITEISKETGFSNLTHFNRVFKAVTGMTPSGYRKAHKNQQFVIEI